MCFQCRRQERSCSNWLVGDSHLNSVCFSVVQGQSLTSSEPVVKRPSESVTLSCTVSGFSMASYWTHWIRQKPGKGLEWIGLIDSGTGTIFAQSLQGQFTITKDSSKNQLYLEVKSLKTKGSAVYYCARDTVTKKLVSENILFTITQKYLLCNSDFILAIMF
uniref:Ig-like domain-containing protein n=1 Tax=Oncorhynchus mykiss TaxID=8022 RepID=A0A8C7M572_ONCMY